MQLEEKLTSTQAPFLLSQWQQKPRCSHLADDPQTSWEFSVKKGRQLSRAYYTPLKTTYTDFGAQFRPLEYWSFTMWICICDVMFWYMVLACCLTRLHILTSTQKQLGKDWRRLHIIQCKRENTQSSMTFIKALKGFSTIKLDEICSPFQRLFQMPLPSQAQMCLYQFQGCTPRTLQPTASTYE